MSRFVYHEKQRVPLFNFKYDLVASKNLLEGAKHMDTIYPALRLAESIPLGLRGYTVSAVSRVHGNVLIVLIEFDSDSTGVSNQTQLNGIHEAVHLSWEILRRAGINISEDDQEAQAYLVESLSKEIFEFLERAHGEKVLDEQRTNN